MKPFAPPAGPQDVSSGRLIHSLFRILSEVERNIEVPLRRSGLTKLQWRALFELDTEGAPMSVSLLAERMGLGVSSTSRVVTQLEELGCVTKARRLDDGRNLDVTLSDRGRKAIDELRPTLDIVYQQIQVIVGREKIADMAAITMQISSGLD